MSLDLLASDADVERWIPHGTTGKTLPNGQQHELAAQRDNQILPLRHQQHKLAQRTDCPPWQAYMRRRHSCARLIRPITGSASLSCRSPDTLAYGPACQHYHTCLATLLHKEARVPMPHLQYKEIRVGGYTSSTRRLECQCPASRMRRSEWQCPASSTRRSEWDDIPPAQGGQSANAQPPTQGGQSGNIRPAQGGRPRASMFLQHKEVRFSSTRR